MAEHQSNSCEAQKPDVPCAADALNDVKALWCSEWFPRVSRSSVNQAREGEPHSVAMDGIRVDLTVPDLQFLGMHASSAALEEASNEDFFSTEVKFHLRDEFTSTLAHAVLKYGSVSESASRIARGMRENILGNTHHQEGLPFQEVLHVKRALAALLDVTTTALSSMGRDWEHAKRLSFGDANLFSQEQFNSSTSTSE